MSAKQTKLTQREYTLEDIKNTFFPNRDINVYEIGIDSEENKFAHGLFHDILRQVAQPDVKRNASRSSQKS
jgi:hypothetical protein